MCLTEWWQAIFFIYITTILLIKNYTSDSKQPICITHPVQSSLMDLSLKFLASLMDLSFLNQNRFENLQTWSSHQPSFLSLWSFQVACQDYNSNAKALSPGILWPLFILGLFFIFDDIL